jgi:hypothetical protein
MYIFEGDSRKSTILTQLLFGNEDERLGRLHIWFGNLLHILKKKFGVDH